MTTVKFISSKQIDANKWNSLVENSTNGLIYAYTWYLDHMADSWNACVYGDYEAVLPLPTKTKWGFTYAYQPAFLQQLGVICLNDDVDFYLNSFLPILKKKYSYINIKLNFKHKDLRLLNNYILPLNKSLENIQQGFNRSFKEAYKQSRKYEGRLLFSNDLKNALEFNAQLYDYRDVHLKTNEYSKFEKLCEFIKNKNQCIIPTWIVDNKIVAQAIVFFDNKRFYLMTSACLEEGRAMRANHALMYNLLTNLSEEQKIFDFEGSNIIGVAKFYESMGGQLETYPPLNLNYLPKIISWIKNS